MGRMKETENYTKVSNDQLFFCMNRQPEKVPYGSRPGPPTKQISLFLILRTYRVNNIFNGITIQ